MEKKTVNIYLATSLKAPRKAPGTYLWLLETDTKSGPATLYKTGYKEDTTENQSCLLALKESLSRLRVPCLLHIFTDCAYMAAALEKEWYKEWEINDWKNKKGKQVQDEETWRELSSLLRLHDLSVHLKEAHSYKSWMATEIQTGGKKDV